MMTKKIEFWARLGQISFWIYQIFLALYEMQLTTYDASIYSGTFIEKTYVTFCLVLSILFSEAIVRIIVYFSKMIEEKN